MTNKSKIRKSKQEWKLYSSFIGFVIAGGVMFYGIKQTTAGTETTIDLILYSLVAEIIIGVFACGSIRCPECKLKWVWHAVSKKDSNQWVSWLLSFEECPQCAAGAKKRRIQTGRSPGQNAAR
jgi:hypothetical protein